MKKHRLLILTSIMLLVLAACTTAEPAAVDTNSAETEAVAEEAMADDVEMAEDDAMMDDGEMAEGDAMMEEDSHSDDAMMDDNEMAEDDAMMDDGEMAEDDAMMDDDSHSDDAAMDDGEMAEDDAMVSDDSMMDDGAMADRPAWQQLALTNAVTGESFTLADFKDKTVFVEPMATWCTNCRRQLNSVRDAQAELGDDVVFIGLSIETTMSEADLASYASNNGYESFVWAVMTPEILQALADVFGQSVANPPSTPHFIIAADGTYSDLDTGSESTAEIIEQISALQ